MKRVETKANDEKVDKFSSSQVVEAYLKWATNCIENKDAYSILQDELHKTPECCLIKSQEQFVYCWIYGILSAE